MKQSSQSVHAQFPGTEKPPEHSLIRCSAYQRRKIGLTIYGICALGGLCVVIGSYPAELLEHDTVAEFSIALICVLLLKLGTYNLCFYSGDLGLRSLICSSVVLLMLFTLYMYTSFIFFTIETHKPPYSDTRSFGLTLAPNAGNGYIVSSRTNTDYYVWQSTADDMIVRVNLDNKLCGFLETPFTFQYLTYRINTVSVCQDGVMQFVGLTSHSRNNNRNMPIWFDYCRVGGLFIAARCGAQDKYIVSFKNTSDYLLLLWSFATTNDPAFQIILSKNGMIDINYQNLQYSSNMLKLGGNSVSAEIGWHAAPLYAVGKRRLNQPDDLPFYSSENVSIDLFPDAIDARHMTDMASFLIKLAILITTVLLIVSFYPVYFNILLRAKRQSTNTQIVANKLTKSQPQSPHRISNLSQPSQIVPTDDNVEDSISMETEILSKDERFLARFASTIEQHISEYDLTVSTVSDYMYVSQRQLYRKIQELTGNTPADFIRNIRLDYARKLIMAKAVNITEAANSVGFRDISHFGQLYKGRFGETASETLKRMKEK